MSNDFNQANPYQSPSPYGNWGQNPNDPASLIAAVKGKVMAPAIALIVVAAIGLMCSLFNSVFAIVVTPPPPDPNAPEFFREMQANAHGPVAATLHAVFAIMHCVTIAGAVQMLRFKTHTLGITGSVLAMINFGTFCCLLGLPVGIWSLVVLLSQNVSAAFKANR